MVKGFIDLLKKQEMITLQTDYFESLYFQAHEPVRHYWDSGI
jgi:hypothetical protein